MVSVTSALTHLVSLLGVCKGGFAYPYHLPAFPGSLAGALRHQHPVHLTFSVTPSQLCEVLEY